MSLNTLAHEEDTVEDRGRLCPHEVPEVLRLVVLTSRRAKRQREEFEEEGPVTLQQLVRAKAMRWLFAQTFLQHTTSYDMVSRAPVSFTDGKMTHPWLELAEANFRELTRFNKQHFLDCCGELALLPPMIVAPSRCHASRALAMFCLLRRWAVPDTLARQAKEMRCTIAWLTQIINAAIQQLMDCGYRRLITTFDFVRIKPRLDEWAAAVQESSPGGTPGVVCWADGKPWKFPKPGCGAAARNMAAAAGVQLDDVQRSFYNRNYRGHGVKVQEVVFADGIKYSYCFSLRRHDSHVMVESGHSDMLSALFLSDGSPAKCVTDQAYRETSHLLAKTRTRTLANMSAAQRAIVAAEDAANMFPRGNIEGIFGKHVSLFPGADKIARQRLFGGGNLRWGEICDTWYAQALWANLHCCCYGNQTTGQTVCPPPSYSSYLSNINEGLYV